MTAQSVFTVQKYAEIADEIRGMIIEESSAPGNMMDPSFFRFHIAIVEDYACRLAPLFGARRELVQIASLIHDISAIRDYKNLAKHHILGADIAKEILKDKIPPDECDIIADAIRNHNAPVLNASPEAVVLSHADALSKFDSPVFWISYALKRRFQTLDESIAWYGNLLSTTYESMDPRARALIEDRYAHVRVLFAGLSAQ